MHSAKPSSLVLAILVVTLASCSSSSSDTNAPDSGAGGQGADAMPGQGADASSPPLEITGHIDDSCNLDVFAGFQVTIEEEATTCTTRYMGDGDIIQFTVGETRGEPLGEGRTYTVVPQTAAFPNDGEAHAVLSGPNSQAIASGTLTIGAAVTTGEFVGSYDVTTSSGNLATAFRSDRCPQDPGDCE